MEAIRLSVICRVLIHLNIWFSRSSTNTSGHRRNRCPYNMGLHLGDTNIAGNESQWPSQSIIRHIKNATSSTDEFHLLKEHSGSVALGVT